MCDFPPISIEHTENDSFLYLLSDATTSPLQHDKESVRTV